MNRNNFFIHLALALVLILVAAFAGQLSRWRKQWKPPEKKFTRGYGHLFAEEITQANEGCDFRFLHAGAPTAEPDIY